MIVRRLLPSDTEVYRRLRLEGLRQSPASFGSSYREETKRAASAFATRLEQSAANWVFGAFERNQLVGMVALVRESQTKEHHKASIFGMYVHARMRRKGIGRALMRTVLEIARQLRGLRQVRLSVVESNRPAVRLYESFGFKVYGREEAALLVGGRFFAELLLVRRVSRKKTNKARESSLGAVTSRATE
jgi:ribosomal protein S18 acetylase RimI-like enzyme